MIRRMSRSRTGPAFEPVSVVSIERRRQAPRRFRVLLPVIIVAIVVLVFGFAAVFLVTYHPVEAGPALSAGRFAKTERGGRLPPGPVRFRFRAGRGTSIGVLLGNGGELTIKVTGVELEGGELLRSTKARLPFAEDDRTVAPEATRSLQSLGLDPGEARWVVLVLRFGTRCPKGEKGVLEALRVRYSVFELPKEMRVTLPRQLVVRCGGG